MGRLVVVQCRVSVCLRLEFVLATIMMFPATVAGLRPGVGVCWM